MSVLDMLSAPWAITPARLDQIHSIYQAKVAGESLSVAELEARMGRSVNNDHKGYEVVDGVAVIPVDGVMSKRANMFQAISGGASTRLLTNDLEQALDDSAVHTVLFVFDSPGGAVDGLPEFAEAIYRARDKKRIVSVADGLMASAAVWSGVAASEVYSVGEATLVGSIGVITKHIDVSEMERKAGRVTTEIYAGKFKAVGSPHKSLDGEARSILQERVDYLYSLFVESVAKYRGQSAEYTLANMADAKVFTPKQAQDVGLIDGQYETVELLIQDLAAKAGPSSAGQRRPFATTTQPTTGAAMPDPNNSNPADTPTITAAFIAEQHPDIAAHFRAEGEAAGTASGATAERERIQAVLDQSMPGHEALVQTLAFDGKTTGPEAAVQVLQAEKKAKAKVGTDLSSDAPDPVPTAAKEGLEEKPPKASEKDPKVLAAAARELVDNAEVKGQKLSYADAMRQVTNES